MNKKPSPGQVGCLVGRRIDPLGDPNKRFPLSAVPLVRKKIRAAFEACNLHTLICSAACGADLTAIGVAEELGIHCHLVLPMDLDYFRATSVVDRPGDWGPEFDRVVELARIRNDLVIVDGAGLDETIYDEINQAILDNALALSDKCVPVCFLVWEGRARAGTDYTARFCKLAANAGMTIEEINTWDC